MKMASLKPVSKSPANYYIPKPIPSGGVRYGLPIQQPISGRPPIKFGLPIMPPKYFMPTKRK